MSSGLGNNGKLTLGHFSYKGNVLCDAPATPEDCVTEPEMTSYLLEKLLAIKKPELSRLLHSTQVSLLEMFFMLT